MDGATFGPLSGLILIMNTIRKLAMTAGIASSALLAAWLLTGDRKVRARALVGKGAASLKALRTWRPRLDDDQACYL